MLFLHEVHRVQGAKEDEFEAAYRDYWMPTMAKSDYARLLWYTNHALGTGVSYNVVTITAVEDGRAWEDLIQRVQKGDLKSWMLEVDNLRHDVVGKVPRPRPLVATAGSRPGVRAGGREVARAEPLHGGHRMALRSAGRLHPGLARHLLRAVREDVPRPTDAGHPGVLPAGARDPSAAGGDAMAEDTQTGDPHEIVEQGGPAGTTRPRYVYARGPRTSGPVGEQAAQDERLVAPVLSLSAD